MNDILKTVPLFKGSFEISQVTPAFVGNLMPAQQTELVLLLRERGIWWGDMEDATGLSQIQLMEIAAQRHRVSLGDKETKSEEESRLTTDAAHSCGVPVNAARALLWLWQTAQETIITSFDRLEEGARLTAGSGEKAMEWLLRNQHIRLAEARRRGRASSYSLTKRGKELALRLNEGLAA